MRREPEWGFGLDDQEQGRAARSVKSAKAQKRSPEKFRAASRRSLRLKSFRADATMLKKSEYPECGRPKMG